MPRLTSFRNAFISEYRMASGEDSLDTALSEQDLQICIHDDTSKEQKLVVRQSGAWCDPCDSRNTYMPAHEYCPHCKEYFCVECSDYHGRFGFGRQHKTLQGLDMPEPHLVNPPLYEKCNTHGNHSSDQFCTRHKEILCCQCASEAHKSCEIKPVPEASAAFTQNDVCAFKDKLIDIRKDIESKLSLFEENISEIEQQRAFAAQNLGIVYETITRQLENLLKEANDEIDRVYNQLKTYLMYRKCTLTKVINNIEHSLTNLCKLKEFDVKTFLHIQAIAKLAREDTFKVNEISKNVHKVSISVNINQNLQDQISAAMYLGTAEEKFTQYTDMNNPNKSLALLKFPVTMSTYDRTNSFPSYVNKTATKKERFTVKLSDDNKDCGIVGIDVTKDGRLFLADFLNLKIKCFDLCNEYLSGLRINYQPSDLAVVNNDEALVSLWCQNEIYVLDICPDEMMIRKKIKMKCPVSAISSCKDKIIVNCREGTGCIKLIDRSGKVYWSRSIDSEERQLFEYPRCNNCYKYNKKPHVIITDYNKQTITMLNGKTGDVKAICGTNGKNAFGVSNDKEGRIYVCYRDTSEIAVWTPDIQKHSILLSESDGLGNWPNCIKYVNKLSMLYVAYSALKESRNFIDCFQFND